MAVSEPQPPGRLRPGGHRAPRPTTPVLQSSWHPCEQSPDEMLPAGPLPVNNVNLSQEGFVNSREQRRLDSGHARTRCIWATWACYYVCCVSSLLVKLTFERRVKCCKATDTPQAYPAKDFQKYSEKIFQEVGVPFDAELSAVLSVRTSRMLVSWRVADFSASR